jgi:hypothetical protein
MGQNNDAWTTPLVFTETHELVKAGKKTVTRRICDRAPGGTVKRYRVGCYSKMFDGSPRTGGKQFGVAFIMSRRMETLYDITPEEVALEGYPNLSPAEFIALFRKINKHRLEYGFINPRDINIWRIEFTVIDPEIAKEIPDERTARRHQAVRLGHTGKAKTPDRHRRCSSGGR